MVYEYRIDGASMRIWLKRSVSLLAIYVIALTTILSTVAAPRPAGAIFDPFSVICHTGAPADAASEPQPAAPDTQPKQACDHCTLCNATPAAAVTFDGAVIGILAPGRPLHTPRPAESVRHADIGGSPRQAQAPPSTN